MATDAAAQPTEPPGQGLLVFQPSISPTLQLVPAAYERHFRISVTYKETSGIVDTCRLVAVLTVTGLFLRWNENYIGPGYWHRVGFGTLFLLECLMQLLWMKRAQASYVRHREAMYIVHRLLRLSHLAVATYHTHLAVNPPNPTPLPAPPDAQLATHILDAFTAPLAAYPLLTTTKLILLTSGSMAALIPALITPLPFRHQLPLQLLTAAFLVTYQIPLALRLLPHILPPAGPQSKLCHALSHVAYISLLQVGWAPTSSWYLTSSDFPLCNTQATRMLLIGAVLFVGLALPTYLTYCLERYIKQLYLQREHGQAQHRGLPLALEAVLLGMLGLLAWLLLMQWHEVADTVPEYISQA